LYRKIDVDVYGPVVEEELMFQWTYSTDIYIAQPENVTSATELLIQTLTCLSSLQWLGLSIPYESRKQFEEAMQGLEPSDLPIPAKSVSLGPYTQSILRHLPSVKDVSMRDWSFTYRQEAQISFIVTIAGLPLDHVKLWADGNLSRNIEGAMIQPFLEPSLTFVHSIDEWYTIAQAAHLGRWDARQHNGLFFHLYLYLFSCTVNI
jgi:hypothetical protein